MFSALLRFMLEQLNPIVRYIVLTFGWGSWALLVLASPAAGQTASDTLQLTIKGDLFAVGITIPFPLDNVKVGDTLTFQAQAVNELGVEVSAVFTWTTWTVGCGEPTCPPALVIDSSSGFAQAIRRTKAGERVLVAVRADQLDELVLGWVKGPGDYLRMPPALIDLQLQPGIWMCLYGLRQGQLIAGAAPPCPAPFGAVDPGDRTVDGIRFPAPWFRPRRVTG